MTLFLTTAFSSEPILRLLLVGVAQLRSVSVGNTGGAGVVPAKSPPAPIKGY